MESRAKIQHPVLSKKRCRFSGVRIDREGIAGATQVRCTPFAAGTQTTLDSRVHAVRRLVSPTGCPRRLQ